MGHRVLWQWRHPCISIGTKNKNITPIVGKEQLASRSLGHLPLSMANGEDLFRGFNLFHQSNDMWTRKLWPHVRFVSETILFREPVLVHRIGWKVFQNLHKTSVLSYLLEIKQNMWSGENRLYSLLSNYLWTRVIFIRTQGSEGLSCINAKAK